MRRSNRLLRSALVTVLVGPAFMTLPAQAQLEGTVYFNVNAAGGGTWSMAPDGSNKTPLPSWVFGEPSHELHAGQRWWLQVLETRVIETPSFTGNGPDDLAALSAPGEPAPTEAWWINYHVEIDGSNPDTFQWWAEASFFTGFSATVTGVPLATDPDINELALAGYDAALHVQFGSANGHTSGDRWVITVNRSQPPSLYAVAEDGVTQTLLSDPLTDLIGMDPRNAIARWATSGGAKDAVVSWSARRLDLGTGQVIEEGIYVADVTYDGAGNVSGLAAHPTAPLAAGNDIDWHDWAPDGTTLVFSTSGGTRGSALWTADASTGQETLVTTNVFQPRPMWSPDGSKIAFRSYDPRGISTIAPDGSGEDLIIWGNGVTRVLLPRWSPTGSHLVFSRDSTSMSGNRDVYRATDRGKQKSNLAPDVVEWCSPVAWRGDGGGTPTPPANPSDLGATAASSSQIDLAWTDNADNEDGFEIERSPDGAGNWSQIATPGPNATSYSDTGLAAETTYYYRVRAVNAQGPSGYSHVASATTLTGGGVLAVVDCIVYDTAGGPAGDKHLNVTVTIVDETMSPVVGATVTVDFFKDSVPYDSDAGATNSAGEVTFTLRNAPNGTYVTDVLTVDGFVLGGSQPINSFDKGTDPPPVSSGRCGG